MSSIAMALVFSCFLDMPLAKLEDEFFYVKLHEILQISPGAYIFQDPIYKGLHLKGLIMGGFFA